MSSSTPPILSRLELEASRAIVALLEEVYKHSTKDALALVDCVTSSGSNCKYYLPFVRHSMWYLSKNDRLADAKNIADKYFSIQNDNVQDELNGDLKREYKDICLRISQGSNTPEPTSSYYDLVYKSSEKYSENACDSIYISTWRKIADLLETIPKTKPLLCLDIGCGPGQFAEYLCQRLSNLRYVGVDTSSAAILLAKKRLPNATFKCGALSDLPLSLLHATDTFLALEVLEHIVDDLDLIESLPSGKRMIFSVPNFDSFGHVRFFSNASRVHARYSSLFLDLNIQPVFLGKNKAVIYICHGIKL